MAFSNEDVMKINTIKRIIRDRLEQFDQELPQVITQYLKDGIITGGAFASLWHHEEPNDWDFYFNDSNTMSVFQALMYNTSPNSMIMDHVKDSGPYFKQVQIDGKLVTANAVSFKGGLQMITMATANHRKYFDFIHCMPYYDYNKDELRISQQQLDSIKRKEIIKNPNSQGTPKPFRVEKYLDRGWGLLTAPPAMATPPLPPQEGAMRVRSDGRIEVFANGRWISP